MQPTRSSRRSYFAICGTVSDRGLRGVKAARSRHRRCRVVADDAAATRNSAHAAGCLEPHAPAAWLCTAAANATAVPHCANLFLPHEPRAATFHVATTARYGEAGCGASRRAGTRRCLQAEFSTAHVFASVASRVHAAAATRAAIRGAAAVCRRAAGAARCERGAGAGAGHRARVDLARAIGADSSRGDGACADARPRAARRPKKRGGRAFHTVTAKSGMCMCMRHENSSLQYIKTQRPRPLRQQPPPSPPPPRPSSTRSLRETASATASRDPRPAPTRPRRGRRCQIHSDHRGTC